MNDRLAATYLLLLLAHVAHVFEEVWGRFWLIDGFWGLGPFLVANWLLLTIPFGLFYFSLRRSRRALSMSRIYAAVMMLNGLGHLGATLWTGRYFDGFAGAATGLLLVPLGGLLLWQLRDAPTARPEPVQPGAI